MMRILLIPVAAFAIVASALLLFISAQEDASAGVGSAQNMALDMDPTGNTATSIGENQQCARINNNDTLDADEDSQADAVDVDLTITGIPAETAAIGFVGTLSYDEGALTVQNIDVNYLLNSLPNSSMFSTSDPAPDTDGNNEFVAGALDVSGDPATAESGTGVLGRLTIGADDGANPFQYVIGFVGAGGDLASGHIDETSSLLPPGSVTEAWIAVDMECGATPPPPPTPSPTPTPPPFVKGDVQCDGDVDAVDALTIQRFIAQLNISQQPGCPPIGVANARIAGAGSALFGDINCNGAIDAVDSLFILRFVASLSVSLPGGCGPIGQ